MSEAQVVGLVVMAIITLGSFVAVIMKFVQPINDLRIVIQKLNDNIDSMKKDTDNHEKRITKHGEEIDKLDGRVGKLELRVDMYHNNKDN